MIKWVLGSLCPHRAAPGIPSLPPRPGEQGPAVSASHTPGGALITRSWGNRLVDRRSPAGRCGHPGPHSASPTQASDTQPPVSGPLPPRRTGPLPAQPCQWQPPLSRDFLLPLWLHGAPEAPGTLCGAAHHPCLLQALRTGACLAATHVPSSILSAHTDSAQWRPVPGRHPGGTVLAHCF